MTLEAGSVAQETADWLFSISDGRGLPGIDGLVAVENYERSGRPPEEVAIMEKEHSYGARAVFFEAERNGRAPVPQAFIFDARSEEHTSELQSLMRISYAVFCLQKKHYKTTIIQLKCYTQDVK